MWFGEVSLSVQWHHNGCDGGLLNRLFRRRWKKHQSSAPMALVRGIHRWPVDSPHKWPVTRKMFPSYDVIMYHAKFALVVGALIFLQRFHCFRKYVTVDTSRDYYSLIVARLKQIAVRSYIVTQIPCLSLWMLTYRILIENTAIV